MKSPGARDAQAVHESLMRYPKVYVSGPTGGIQRGQLDKRCDV